MSFPGAVARQQDAVFRALGEDATWSGIGVVRVIRRDADEQVGFTHATALVEGRRVRVRKSQVPSPGEGQILQVLDDSGDPLPDALFAIIGEPKLDRRGVWTCIVQPVA